MQGGRPALRDARDAAGRGCTVPPILVPKEPLQQRILPAAARGEEAPGGRRKAQRAQRVAQQQLRADGPGQPSGITRVSAPGVDASSDQHVLLSPLRLDEVREVVGRCQLQAVVRRAVGGRGESGSASVRRGRTHWRCLSTALPATTLSSTGHSSVAVRAQPTARSPWQLFGGAPRPPPPPGPPSTLPQLAARAPTAAQPSTLHRPPPWLCSRAR